MERTLIKKTEADNQSAMTMKGGDLLQVKNNCAYAWSVSRGLNVRVERSVSPVDSARCSPNRYCPAPGVSTQRIPADPGKGGHEGDVCLAATSTQQNNHAA